MVFCTEASSDSLLQAFSQLTHRLRKLDLGRIRPLPWMVVLIRCDVNFLFIDVHVVSEEVG